MCEGVIATRRERELLVFVVDPAVQDRRDVEALRFEGGGEGDGRGEGKLV